MSKRLQFDPMLYAKNIEASENFALLNATLHRWVGGTH